MYLVITKHTRPDTTVEFYNFKESTQISDETREHFVNTYVLTGKIVHTAWERSEDELSTTSQAFWLSKEDFDAYKDDPILVADFFPARDAYYAENGIVLEPISAEVI